MNKYLIFLIVFASFTMLGCTTVVSSTGINKQSDKNIVDDSYAVYDCLLKGYQTSPEDGKKVYLIVIRENTEINRMPDEKLENLNLNVPNEFKTALEDYKVKNKEPQKLTRSFELTKNYILISLTEIESAFKNPQGKGLWDSFYKTYPNSPGIITFSKVGFDTQKEHAIVFKVLSCGGLCADGSYYLLTKKQGVWELTKTMNIWVS